eukprot:COSAG01_NODE_380_length_17862_cov_20.427212_11_plen_101_part_00
MKLRAMTVGKKPPWRCHKKRPSILGGLVRTNTWCSLLLYGWMRGSTQGAAAYVAAASVTHSHGQNRAGRRRRYAQQSVDRFITRTENEGIGTPWMCAFYS